MAAPRPRKASGNNQVTDVQLDVMVRWNRVLGTTVRFQWHPEGKAPVLGEKPLYEVTREGFEVHTLDEAVDALRGCWVAMQMMRDAATKTD